MTTRHAIEKALHAYLTAEVMPSYTGWQLVRRWLVGRLATPRVSVGCRESTVLHRHEDGTPAVLDVTVVVRLASHVGDDDFAGHDALLDRVLYVMHDAERFAGLLRQYWTQEGAEVRVLYVDPDGVTSDEVVGKTRVSDVRAVAMVVPLELAAEVMEGEL